MTFGFRRNGQKQSRQEVFTVQKSLWLINHISVASVDAALRFVEYFNGEGFEACKTLINSGERVCFCETDDLILQYRLCYFLKAAKVTRVITV